MDLNYPAEAETFRVEIRQWLEDNLPDGWFDEGFELSPAARAALMPVGESSMATALVDPIVRPGGSLRKSVSVT